MKETIPHWLEKQYELNPDHIAIEQPGGQKLTFAELREESRELAAGMLEQGITSGDHVAMFVDNDRDVPIYIHALSYVGAVVVLLNTRLTPKELCFQLRDADVGHLFVGKGLETKMAETTNRLHSPHLKTHVMSHFKKGEVSGKELNKTLDFDQVFTMMYTSGTTGHPKAVMHTYGNHWFSAVSSALNLGLSPNDKWLICLPMFHIGGFSILMKSVIYGMTITLVPKFDETMITKEIMSNHVTHISVVTVMMKRLLNELGEKTYPDHFRCMLLGGGPAPHQLLEEAATKQIPVFQTYGMTETSSQVATLSPSASLRKLGSAGKALTPAELIIENGKKGEIGEILVRGPMVSSGYYKRTKSHNEYFRTGDLGYKDEEGFLYVVDRAKDMIISGGENVYPAEIESVLTEFPGIQEAGVTGQSHDIWGEVPIAFVVLNQTGRFDKDEVIRFCEQRLAKYKVPKHVYLLTELPRNASNKILRRKLFTVLNEEEA